MSTKEELYQNTDFVKEKFATLLKEQLSEQITSLEQEENFRLSSNPKHRDGASSSIFRNIRSVITASSNIERRPFDSIEKSETQLEDYTQLLENLKEGTIFNKDFVYCFPKDDGERFPVGTSSEEEFIKDLTEQDTILQIIHNNNSDWNIMINYTKGSATDAWLINHDDHNLAINLEDLLGDINFLESEHRLDFAELVAFRNIISNRLLDNIFNKIIKDEHIQNVTKLIEERQRKRERLMTMKQALKKINSLLEPSQNKIQSSIIVRLEPLLRQTSEENSSSLSIRDNTMSGTLNRNKWTYDLTKDILKEDFEITITGKGNYSINQTTIPSRDGESYTVKSNVNGKLSNFGNICAIETFDLKGNMINQKSFAPMGGVEIPSNIHYCKETQTIEMTNHTSNIRL